MLPLPEPFDEQNSNAIDLPPQTANALPQPAPRQSSMRDDGRGSFSEEITASPLRQTRSHLMQVFQENQLHPRHDLGQNFLIDLNLLELIVQTAELTPADVVLEVGAGTGGLTTFLADAAGHVISVEYDTNMHRLASENLREFENVTLLQTDALKNKHQFADCVTAAVNQELQDRPNARLKLVANLPYHIGTPVMANLIASSWPWERMVVTIQYELAERMLAGPGTAEFGALSVLMQSYCQTSIIRKLGPSVFWPRPKVDSAILFALRDLEAEAEIVNGEFFREFLREAFSQRRKLLRGVLAHQFRGRLTKDQIDQVFAELQIDPGVRAEELSVATFVKLGNAFSNNRPVTPREARPFAGRDRSDETNSSS